MSLLIESIKLLDGEFCNLAYHEARMQHSLSSLFGRNDKPELKTFLLGANYHRKVLHDKSVDCIA